MPTPVVVPELTLFNGLSKPEERPEATLQLAKYLGADEAYLYVHDETTGEMLPAEGMPQVVHGGAAWQRFLSTCLSEGQYHDIVDVPPMTLCTVNAYAKNGVAIILLGEDLDQERLSCMHQLLPLLGATLVKEQELDTARQSAAAESSELSSQLRRKEHLDEELLAALGHELRNPVAAMQSALQGVQRTLPLKTTERGALEVMDRQIVELAILIDRYTAVERRNPGIKLDNEQLDLCTVVVNVVAAASHALLPKNQHVEVVRCPEPLPVFGDIVRLSQVFANLLNNAIKFSGEDGSIRVAMWRDAGQAVVELSDDGVGMTEDFAASVQAGLDEAPVTPRPGARRGLGLLLTQRLLKLHGATVDCSSPGPGQGSTFTVRIPMVALAHTLQPLGAAVQRAQLSLLVVDDNLDVAEGIATLLSLEGHKVDYVHDGAAALALLSERVWDIAFLDIGMPGMDGYELAQRLRSAKGTPLRLVACTGYGGTEVAEAAAAAGFDAHLVKPLRESELLEQLWLARRDVDPASAETTH